MAHGEFTISIERPAQEILDFILDVESYRQVDPRLKTIRWVRRAPDCTVFRFRPQLMGMPAPLSTQMVVRRGDKVAINPLPSANDRLATFVGAMECVEGAGSTAVTRSLRFDLTRPVRWALEARLQRWLDHDVRAEMERLKAHLERS